MGKRNGAIDPRTHALAVLRTSFLIRLPVHPQATGPGPAGGSQQTNPPVTGEVTGEVALLLSAFTGEMKRMELQAALGLKHEDHFREAYLVPALEAGWIERTIPGKPRSRLQRYRLTRRGQAWVASRAKREEGA